MRNPGGTAIWTGIGPDGGGVRERDTFTCPHCNKVVFVEPFCAPADAGGWCAMCGKPTCGEQGCATCIPFEKKLEAIEKAERQGRHLDSVLPW